jgi:hypothetical protein
MNVDDARKTIANNGNPFMASRNGAHCGTKWLSF